MPAQKTQPASYSVCQLLADRRGMQNLRLHSLRPLHPRRSYSRLLPSQPCKHDVRSSERISHTTTVGAPLVLHVGAPLAHRSYCCRLCTLGAGYNRRGTRRTRRTRPPRAALRSSSIELRLKVCVGRTQVVNVMAQLFNRSLVCVEVFIEVGESCRHWRSERASKKQTGKGMEAVKKSAATAGRASV